MDSDEEDPRVQRVICGLIEIGITGIERICVAKPHAQIYIRKSGRNKGQMKFSDGPKADQHYFVKRWPNRPKE